MLECVKRQMQTRTCLPVTLRDDKDIFRAVLNHHQTLPPEFLLQFSEALRSDPSLMQDVFKHPGREMSFLQHCSVTLRSDKQFLLEVLGCFQFKDSRDQRRHNSISENQILRYTSQQLRNDSDFVIRCVQQSGFNLQHASDDLRSDPQILAAACTECREAIAFGTQEAVDGGLWRNKPIAQSVITHAGDRGLVNTIIERYRKDVEVTSMSILNPLIEWTMIPDGIRSNTDFVIKALQVKPAKVWQFLPLEMKSTLQIAAQLLNNPNSTEEIILDAIETCSELLSDRETLKQILLHHFYAGRGAGSVYYNKVFYSGKINIGNDKDLILIALSQADVWRFVSEELLQDCDFVLQVAEKFPFLNINVDTRAMGHLDILELGMKKHPDYFRQHGENIWPQVWEYRDLCMDWLEMGGGWLWNHFEWLEDDAEAILLATRHRWEDFNFASNEMRQDKAFVLQALAVDTRILKFVAWEVITDDEVVMTAMSKDIRCIDSFNGGRGFDDHTSFISLTQKIRLRMKEYWAFQEAVIESKKQSVQDEQESNLTKLNQGRITLATYIDKIASYVGVMEEKEIAFYTTISKNLAAWGL